MSEREAADAIAADAGLVVREEVAGGFRLLTYVRGLDRPDGPLHVYIEGDGRAWRGRRPPPDPTPFEPLGLLLAARDPAPALLWIGRPCMYLSEGGARRCGTKWWTSHRYAPEVIAAMDRVVTAAARGRPVVLTGHSGGGALATLLAARRDDVQALLTVAAPLDLAYWVETERMTPLHGSLDPVDSAHLLADLPQRHFIGGRDRVVAPEVARRYMRALPNPNRARLELRPQYTHVCCWEQEWTGLLSAAP